MRKILLCALALLAGLTGMTQAHATDVTFTTDEGYNFMVIRIYQEGNSSAVNGDAPYRPTTTLDLAPGTYLMEASLEAEDGSVTLPVGSMKTFTVGNTPTTVNYSIAENFVKVRFILTGEAGQPLKDININAYFQGQTELYAAYDFYATTGPDGTAEALAAAGKTFKTSINDPNGHYADLEQTFTTASDGTDVPLSYSDYHRVDFTFSGFYEYPEYPGALYGSVEVKFNDGTSLTPYRDNENSKTTFVVLPAGEYTYTAYADFDADGNDAYTGGVLNVSNENMNQPLDFSGAQPVNFTTEEYATIQKLAGNTTIDLNCPTEGLYLTQGTYIASGSFYDDTNSRNCFFKQHFEVADAPVTVTIDTDPAHYYNVAFDMNTPQGKAQSMCYVNNAIITDLGGTTSPESFQNGTYDYLVMTVWIDDYSYALPYMPGGTLTIQDADVTVPVDLTDHRFFRLRYTLNGGNLSFDEMSLTDSEGRSTANISGGGSDRIGIGLKPGTYTVNGTLNNAPIHGTLTVPNDCPESLTVDMQEGASAIGSVETAGCLDAKAMAGGLQISAAESGHVSVSVYDTMGRLVLTAQAADGETVSTADLSAGIYIARLQQGAALQSMKFVIR